MWAFFIIAITGFCLSLSVHLATFVGVDPQQSFPFVWLLHIGIFIVWLPAILIANRRTKGAPRSDQWRTIFRGAPWWIAALIGPVFLYAFFNFFFTIFVLLGGHSPTVRNGAYALSDHGRVVRTISEHDYHRYRAYEARLFSGHWMLFYLAATAMLYPRSEEADGVSVINDSGPSKRTV
jgi:hypothetical protein